MAIEGGLIGIPLDFLLSFIGRGKVKNLKTEKNKNNDDAVKNFNNKRKNCRKHRRSNNHHLINH